MREVRRTDRLLDLEQANELIKTAEYGVLAMTNIDGGGYAVPMSFVQASNGDLYFHCAPEGHKLENLMQNPQVTFVIVGKTEVIPSKFTTLYQSVMLFGTIHMNLPEQERRMALHLIVEKYSPEYVLQAEKYINGSFHRTNILKMTVHHITAKQKK